MPKHLKLDILKSFLKKKELEDLLTRYSDARGNVRPLKQLDWDLYYNFLEGKMSVRRCASMWKISSSSAYQRLKKMEAVLNGNK